MHENTTLGRKNSLTAQASAIEGYTLIHFDTQKYIEPNLDLLPDRLTPLPPT